MMFNVSLWSAMKRAGLALATLVLAVAATTSLGHSALLTNGRVVIYNALDTRVQIFIYHTGIKDHSYPFAHQEVTFDEICCFVAGTRYDVEILRVKDIDGRLVREGMKTTVMPRLCSRNGLLFGYAHMTVRELNDRPHLQQDDTHCPT